MKKITADETSMTHTWTGARLLLAFACCLALITPALAAVTQEKRAEVTMTELNDTVQGLRKELNDELGPDFPLDSKAAAARLKALHNVYDNYKLTSADSAASDDVHELENLRSSLYLSYSAYIFSLNEAEEQAKRRAAMASADVMRSFDITKMENMGLKSPPPYSIETYDSTFRSLELMRRRVGFDLFALRSNAKSIADNTKELRDTKANQPEGDVPHARTIYELEFENLRLSAAMQMQRTLDSMNSVRMQIFAIKMVAKQLEWISSHLSFTDEERAAVTKQLQKELDKANAARTKAMDAEKIAERDYIQRNENKNPGTKAQQDALRDELFGKRRYSQFVLTLADDEINYINEDIEIWNLRYKIFINDIRGEQISSIRSKAAQRIDELQNKLDYIRRIEEEVQTALKTLTKQADEEKDAKIKKSLNARISFSRSTLNDVIARYAVIIPSHIFMYERLSEEAGQRMDSVRITQNIIGIGSEMVFSFLNTVLWQGEGFNLTVSKLLIAITILLCGFFGSRFLSRLIQKIFLARLSKNVGAATAVQRLLFYVLQAMFLLTALKTVNIPLTAFTFMGGALALGVGFGAQNFFNNLISGFILVYNSPFRIGDIVEIEGTVGTIMGIGDRATILRTFTGVEMFIPNNYLLQNKVINWSGSDWRKREMVSVGVSYDVDPKDVREILTETASRHKEILKKPEPFVIFKDFADSALVFELYYWIDLKSSNALKINSDLRYIISSEFKKHGIAIPFPQMDLHIQRQHIDVVKIVPPEEPSEPEPQEADKPHLP